PSMPNTSHGLPYPNPTDPVAQGAAAIQALASAADTRLMGYGTALPATPVDGQEFILVDSLTNPAYQWRLRYNAGSSSSFKWEFVGGTPIYGIATTNDAAGAGWVQLFPAFGLTRAGEYLCTATVNIIATGPAATVATIGVAAATAAQP